MSDNSPLVNIDLAPLCDLGKYALDKIEKLCGFLYNPKGTEQEAIDRYVERIKEQNLDPEIEAMKISNARKDIKHFSRQNNVVHSALEHIQENKMPLPESEDEYDEEWFSKFFEYAKHVAKEDMQNLWGRILANELSAPGSVTKQLLYVMSIMEREQARAFSKLCSHTISFGNETVILCNLNKETEYWKSLNIDLDTILCLESLGLVSFQSSGFRFKFNVPLDKLCFKTYSNILFEINFPNSKITEINYGNLNFTKTGLDLYNAIEHFYSNVDATFYIKYFGKRGFTIKQI